MASKTYINKDICITSGESGEIDAAEITFNNIGPVNIQNNVTYIPSSGIFNDPSGLQLYSNNSRKIVLNSDVIAKGNINTDGNVISSGSINSTGISTSSNVNVGGTLFAQAISVNNVTWTGQGTTSGNYVSPSVFPSGITAANSYFTGNINVANTITGSTITSTNPMAFNTYFPTSTLPTTTATTDNSIVNKGMNNTLYGRLNNITSPSVIPVTNSWFSTNNFHGKFTYKNVYAPFEMQKVTTTTTAQTPNIENPIPGTVIIEQAASGTGGAVTFTLPAISNDMIGLSIVFRRIYTGSGGQTAYSLVAVKATGNSIITSLNAAATLTSGALNLISNTANTATNPSSVKLMVVSPSLWAVM